MFNFKFAAVEVLAERGFAGLRVGRRQLWWSAEEGIHFDRVPDGYSLSF